MKVKLDEILFEVKSEEISHKDSTFDIISFDNVKMIVSKFADLDTSYKSIKDLFVKNIISISEKIINHLAQKDFNELVSKMNLIIKAKNSFFSHFDSELEDIANNMVKNITVHFENILIVTEEFLNKDQIDIKGIKNSFKVIEEAKETSGLIDIIDKKLLKSIYDKQVIMISAYFEKLNAKVHEALKNKKMDSLKVLKPLVEEIQIIRSIKIIESITSEKYYKIFEEIVIIMNIFEKETIACFENFNKKEYDKFNYDKICSNLLILEDVKWIRDYKKEAYDEIIKQIHEKTIESLLTLSESLFELDLDLSHFENLEKAKTYLQIIENTKKFENWIPEVKQIKEHSVEIFKSLVYSVFKIINLKYNVANESIDNKKNKLAEFKTLRNEYDLLHPSFIFLKEKGFKNIEELQKSIDEIQVFVKVKENKALILIQIRDELEKIEDDKLKRNFLSMKGFQDKNMLDEEIECLTDIIKAKTINQEQLSSNLIYYNDLRLETEVSTEARDLLLNNEFKKVEELDSEIEVMKNEISSAESHDFKYIFNRIDLNDAEKSYSYLDSCCSIECIKHESTQFKLEFEKYLNQYNQSVQSEATYLINEIQSLKSGMTSLALRYAQRLKNRLLELKDIKIKKYTFITRKISSSVYDEIINNLHQFLILSREELNCVANVADTKNLKSKLEILKSLTELDIFVDGKFYQLYLQYQTAESKELKEFYKQILVYIDKFDYKNVAAELLSIDKTNSTINQRDFNQVRNLLSSSINELIERTKYMAIMIPNTLDDSKISDTLENLKKLENAKKYILENFDQNKETKLEADYVDQSTRERLNSVISDIEQLIYSKCLKYMENIETLISMDSFEEVEEQRENLTHLRFLLSSYSINTQIKDKEVKYQQDLEIKFENFLTECEERSINDFAWNPLEPILFKLERAVNLNSMYAKTYNKATLTIMAKFRTALSKTKESQFDDRMEALKMIKMSLSFLPEKMKRVIKAQIENIEAIIMKELDAYEMEYKSIIKNFEKSYARNFMRKCKKEKIMNMHRAMRDFVIKECRDWYIYITHRNEDSANTCLKYFENLCEFSEYFLQEIEEIKEYCSKVEEILINEFNRISSFFMKIDQSEEEKLTREYLKQLESFFEFKIRFNQNSKNLNSIVESKMGSICSGISNFLLNFQTSYELAKKEFNFYSFHLSIKNWNKWSFLFKVTKLNKNLEKKTFIESSSVKEYNEIIEDSKKFLNSLKHETWNFDMFAEYDDSFFISFTKKLVFLKQSKELGECIIGGTLYDAESFEKYIVPHLHREIKKFYYYLISFYKNYLINDGALCEFDFNKFKIGYSNFTRFEKQGRLIDLDFNLNIEEITDEYIHEIVRSSVDCYIIESLAKKLKKLKIFANNLPNLKIRINEKIDKILINFIQNHKTEKEAALTKLCEELKNDPEGIGYTIISEHSKKFEALFDQSKLISEEGGFLRSPLIDLHVPRNAVNESLEFAIKENKRDLKLPFNIEKLSPLFDLQPHSYVFKEPVTLRFKFQNSDKRIRLCKQINSENDRILNKWHVYSPKKQEDDYIEFELESFSSFTFGKIQDRFDVSCTETKHVDFHDQLQRYQYIYEGLNYRIKCEDDHKELMIINKGFGTFHLIENNNSLTNESMKMNCPICKKDIKFIEAIILFQATGIIEFLLDRNKYPSAEETKEKFKNEENSFIIFGDSGNEEKFEKINIKVDKLKHLNSINAGGLLKHNNKLKGIKTKNMDPNLISKDNCDVDFNIDKVNIDYPLLNTEKFSEFFQITPTKPSYPCKVQFKIINKSTCDNIPQVCIDENLAQTIDEDEIKKFCLFKQDKGEYQELLNKWMIYFPTQIDTDSVMFKIEQSEGNAFYGKFRLPFGNNNDTIRPGLNYILKCGNDECLMIYAQGFDTFRPFEYILTCRRCNKSIEQLKNIEAILLYNAKGKIEFKLNPSGIVKVPFIAPGNSLIALGRLKFPEIIFLKIEVNALI